MTGLHRPHRRDNFPFYPGTRNPRSPSRSGTTAKAAVLHPTGILTAVSNDPLAPGWFQGSGPNNSGAIAGVCAINSGTPTLCTVPAGLKLPVATQKIVFALYEVMFDAVSQARVRVVRERWISQMQSSGTMTQRGQQWCGIVEFQQPVIRLAALSFVPVGTNVQVTVIPANGGSGDATVFTVS